MKENGRSNASSSRSAGRCAIASQRACRFPVAEAFWKPWRIRSGFFERSKVLGLLDAFQQVLGSREMRPVEHLAFEIDDAGRRRGRERIDHGARRRDGCFGRRKDLVDNGNLSWMYRHLSCEAVP